MEYTPLSKTKAAAYSKLRTSKLRKKEGMFCVEGTKCVTDTIIHFPLEALIATPGWLDAHASLAASFPGKVFFADKDTLHKLSSLSTPPEVIAVYKTPARRDVAGEKLGPGLYLMLDGVQDPGNLGTIIRTAHWFGLKRIFASPTTADVYSPKAVQSTMGSIAAVKVDYCDLRQLIEENPEIPVCILDLDGDNLFDTELPESAFIVMGSEGEGLSDKIRDLASRKLTIPAASDSHPDSLNVAIAAAITMERFAANTSK